MISNEAAVSETSAEHSALLPPDHGGAADARDALNPAVKPFPEDSPLAGLPMQLDVMIPVPSFRVQDLLALEKGTVLETGWPYTDDVPVRCGGSQLVWSEFEVIDEKLAVRVTRLG